MVNCGENDKPTAVQRRLAQVVARCSRESLDAEPHCEVKVGGQTLHGREHFDRFRHELRAKYVLRKRCEGGQRLAPPPVTRPLVLAAPRERRESRRPTRRPAAARGDPDQSESDIDRRHGAASLRGGGAV